MKEPRIRFKEFGDGIKSRKLANLAKFSKGKGYSKSSLRKQGNPIILYGNMYTNYEAIITDSNHFVDGSANDKVSKLGDVIVPASGETAIDISRASAILSNGIILGGDLNVISPSNGITGEFLAYYLSFGNRKYKIARLAQGKTIVHIHNSDLEKLEINYPDVKEQNKIVNYFYDLDKLIKMQSDKLEHLKRDKKGYLQKMFPNYKRKKPFLRFDEFNSNWISIMIKNIADVVGGGTPSTKNPNYWNGSINWYSPNEISDKPFSYESNKKITKLGLKNSSAKLHPINTILFTSRAGIGKMTIIKNPATTNQGFQSLELKNDIDPYFIYSMNKTIKHKAILLSSGSTFLEISKKSMEKIKLSIPSLPEQQKIGQFFSHFDHLIDLQQQKINHLKQLKQAYLQKMFV